MKSIKTAPRHVREPIFDAPGGLRRWKRAVHRVAVRTVSAALRAAGPAVAVESPTFHLVEIRHVLPTLPPACQGLRLLHLSDLHLETARSYEIVRDQVAALEFDVIVCTGDFAEGPGADRLVASFFGPLLASRPRPCLGVLGNHDRAGLLPALHRAGVDILMNDSREIASCGPGLWFAGVDDPATFGTDDLDRALARVPPAACVVLLAHSPDLTAAAAGRGCALYLCGHTHGGQFRLPGVGPLGYRRRYPHARIAGVWQHEGMSGYTSAGLGAHLGLPRVGCIPEVAVHTLVSPGTRPASQPTEGSRIVGPALG